MKRYTLGVMLIVLAMADVVAYASTCKLPISKTLCVTLAFEFEPHFPEGEYRPHGSHGFTPEGLLVYAILAIVGGVLSSLFRSGKKADHFQHQGEEPDADRDEWAWQYSDENVIARSRCEKDLVDCSVYSPSEISAGETILVQAYVHTPKQASDVQATAVTVDASTRPRGSSSLLTEVARGSRLACELVCPQLLIDEPVQEIVWRGRPESVKFLVTVPGSLEPGSVFVKLLVSQDSVPIGQIKFKLQIIPLHNQSVKAAAERAAWPVGEAKRFQKAFISYAAEDRPEVMRRVQMLNAVGIEDFADVLNLDPGERWERQLYRHIDESDVLFLFWSTPAKQSDWVGREWRYGLDRKGDGFVRPVIIEGPPIPEPPPELAHLHFNDRVLYFIRSGKDDPKPQTTNPADSSAQDCQPDQPKRQTSRCPSCGKIIDNGADECKYCLNQIW